MEKYADRNVIGRDTVTRNRSLMPNNTAFQWPSPSCNIAPIGIIMSSIFHRASRL